MVQLLRETRSLYKIISYGSLVAGCLLAISGLVLVCFGATGDSNLKIFGQTLKTTNVGVATVFIGAVVIIIVLRRLLKSVETIAGYEAKGRTEWEAKRKPEEGYLKQLDEEREYVKQFNPLEISDTEGIRCFSWRGKDPIHRIASEEPPRQLYKFFIPLCEKLRQESGMEPQFNLQNNISGEIVYELSADFRSKWKLLGGRNGASGDQVLVLVPK